MTVQDLINEVLKCANPKDEVEFDIRIDNVDNGIYVEGRKQFEVIYGKDTLIIEVN